jgi:phosphoenolpyruvate carboxylase
MTENVEDSATTPVVPQVMEFVDGAAVLRDATEEEIAEIEARASQAVPAVPQSCAMWQARAILIEDDLLDDVNAVLAAIPDEKARKLAQAKFEYSSTVRRDDPLVTQVIPQLGKSETEIDQMFFRAVVL